MAFWIKICGITNTNDAICAAKAGANAIGLNFFNKSRRFIEPAQARPIVEKLPSKILKVGVFVNAVAPQIARVVEETRINAVQLHGDEPAHILSQLPVGVRIVRAYRCGSEGLAPLARYLDECHALGRMPDALLLDADARSQFGGTGQVADWARIAAERDVLGGLPLILAGGLNPGNVADAIAAVAPQGVDVASGVESAPGQKDATLVAQFVAEARRASAPL